MVLGGAEKISKQSFTWILRTVCLPGTINAYRKDLMNDPRDEFRLFISRSQHAVIYEF